jgi:uncharacterized protein YqgV (UPF0045/DUF77 family)
MTTISAQVSLYPLHRAHTAPAIADALETFRARELEVQPGTMSTIVSGDADAVFDSLKASFEAAASSGDVVMVVTLSNCCPTPAAPHA